MPGKFRTNLPDPLCYTLLIVYSIYNSYYRNVYTLFCKPIYLTVNNYSIFKILLYPMYMYGMNEFSVNISRFCAWFFWKNPAYFRLMATWTASRAGIFRSDPFAETLVAYFAPIHYYWHRFAPFMKPYLRFFRHPLYQKSGQHHTNYTFCNAA